MWKFKEKLFKDISGIKDSGLYGKACGNLIKGDFQLAMKLFEELEEREPESYKQNPLLKSPLGECYTLLERYEDALIVFDPIYKNLEAKYQKENWDSLELRDAKMYARFLYYYRLTLKKLNHLARSDMINRDYQLLSKRIGVVS